jgi:cation transport regulator
MESIIERASGYHLIVRGASMPYANINELPKNVTVNLPTHAQEIFKEAFNNAYDEYKDPKDRKQNDDRENTARRVAWSAVKQKYEKGEDGKWHPKEE